MALEIAGVLLDKLVRIDASEGARFVRHAVPGLSGEYVQDLGRPAVRICVQGIFYGNDAVDKLKALRGRLLDRTPVDFLCDLTGQGYFSQVVVDDLEVGQQAGEFDEFHFACRMSEYVPPPPPPVTDALGGLDGGLLDEAASLVDDAQNALAEVAGLASLLAGAADFGNPTTKLPAMLDAFKNAAGGGVGALADVGKLL